MRITDKSSQDNTTHRHAGLPLIKPPEYGTIHLLFCAVASNVEEAATVIISHARRDES